MDGLVGVGVVGIVALAAAMRLSELWRRRENEATALQARITGALLHDPVLRPLPVTAVVQPGFWPCSRLTVVLVGAAPDDDLHARVRALMARQLRTRRCRYQDRVVVAMPMAEESPLSLAA